MRLAIPATILALAGAAALVTLPSALRAEESARDAVERLMPALLAEDDTQRADAEKSLYALGEPGRAELERITRESDPRRAITALRLLQSGKWAKTAREPGERRAEREDSGTDWNLPADLEQRLEQMRERLESQVEELRLRFETFDKDLLLRMPGLGFRPGGQSGASSGTIVENDKKLTWAIGQDGRIKVTVQDGKDAPERTYEAESLEALKSEHPEVAKRLESVTGGGWTTIWRGPASPRVRIERGPRNLELKPDGSWDLDQQPTPVLGISWSPVPEVLRDQLELGTGGMVVEQVVEKSLAEKLGLTRHDVLLEVQGKPVAGAPDVRAALENAKEGEKVTALVVRKGQRKSLEAVK